MPLRDVQHALEELETLRSLQLRRHRIAARHRSSTLSDHNRHQQGCDHDATHYVRILLSDEQHHARRVNRDGVHSLEPRSRPDAIEHRGRTCKAERRRHGGS